MADVSIYHNIGISKQVKDSCCWFTCFSTVYSYCLNTGRTPCPKNPGDDPVMKGRFLMNFTIPWSESINYATRLGYSSFAGSPTLSDLQKLLMKAPVIFGGTWGENKGGHWMVVNGLSGDQLSYFDPLTGRHVCSFSDFFSGDEGLMPHSEEPLFYVK